MNLRLPIRQRRFASAQLVQRYYNSNAGRFNTADPAGKSAVDPKNPTSWNLYAYVNDHPVNLRDPRGLFLEANLGDDDEGWAEDSYGDAYPICFLFPNGPGCNPWSYIGPTTQGGGVQRGSSNLWPSKSRPLRGSR
jgi:RHS repeat-associated protein